MKLYPKFQNMARCNPSRGDSVLLWSDIWVDQPLRDKYPQLFSFTRKPKCSIRFLLNQQLDRVFTPTLSNIAMIQLAELQTAIDTREWVEEINDSWIYSWGTSKFSSKKAYKNMIEQSEASPLFKWLWAGSNPGAQKFFFWLLIRDRLNTRDMLLRKNMQIPDYTCVMCDDKVHEHYFHLFFECSFAQECWAHMNIQWDFSLNPLDMVLRAKEDFGNIIFREVLITGCWSIWCIRNKIIFDNDIRSLERWKILFYSELGLVCIKSKPNKSNLISAWRDSLS